MLNPGLDDAVNAYLSADTHEPCSAARRTLEAALRSAPPEALTELLRWSIEGGESRSAIRWELISLADDEASPWIVDVPEVVTAVHGYERQVLAKAIATSGHPKRAERYAALVEHIEPLASHVYSILCVIPESDFYRAPGMLPRMFAAARRAHVSGLFARRLAALTEAGTLTPEAATWPSDPPPEAVPAHTLAERIDARLLRAWPSTLEEEVALASDLGDHAVEKVVPARSHFPDKLARKYGFPDCSAYWMQMRLGMAGYSFNSVHSDQGRLALTALAVAAGYVAADEAARSEGVEPVLAPAAPFKNDAAQNRFLDRLMEVGPALLDTSLRDWAVARCDRWLATITATGELPADQDQRSKAGAGLLRSVAVGAALWMTAHQHKPAALAPLAQAVEATGVWGKPKKPNLAALRKAHPARPMWSLFKASGAGSRPYDAVASATNPGGVALCPCLDAHEVPRDDAGAPLPFVAQVRLGDFEGVSALADGAELLVLFQRGRQGRVVTLSAEQVKARRGRPIPAGLVGLVRARRPSKEPVSPEEARLLTPELFTGRQSEDDPETLLGAWAEATRDKRHISSKVGGSYTPVQGRLAHPPGGRLRHLVLQLDFDDGAPLPDAGLTYVFAVEGPERFIVHCEYA